jgi:copper resistance protein C
MMRPLLVRPLRFVLPAAVLALLLMPSLVLAHAELETPTPKDKATVEGTPTEIAGTYSEEMNPDGSSLTLLGPDGSQVAKGGVDPADDKRMVITDLPELAPGAYTVKSTTKSAEDGDIDRKEWTFTVEVAPSPSPSLSPTAAAPTVAPSATPAAPTATAAPTAAPIETPAPSPSADGGTTGSGGDVILPIIAAVVIVAAIAGYLFTRRDRTPTKL